MRLSLGDARSKEAPRIGREEVQRLMKQGAQVLDALPPDDYAKKHIAGAINVPLEKFSPELIRDLDPKKATVTYCADNQCDLSARLAARLIAEGWSEVYEYAASLADWMAFGLPIEGEDAAARTKDLARRKFATCREDERLSDVARRLGSDDVLCAVVDEAGVLLGRLWRKDIGSNPDKTAGQVAHPGPSTFRPDVPLDDMVKWFDKRKVDAFIITTPDGRPFGVLYRADLAKVQKHAVGARA